jgi:hypothetical protein
MKKIIALCILTSISLAGLAQTQWGIFAGPQVTTAKYFITGNKQDVSNKFGFQAGLSCKIPFEKNLYFSPAAFYSMKGYKVNFNGISDPPDSLAINNNTTFHTFELAVLLQYNFGNKPGHFFIKAGPSLDFQLLGNEKYDRSDNTTVDRSMTFSFVNYGRYAANVLLHFGYETAKGLMIFGQYTYGIGNLNNHDEGPRILHRAYGISVGKYF